MKSSGFNSFQGWGVAAACGCINLLTQVPMRLAGLLFVAMIHRYDTNRELASWPFVICLIMRCAPGPLTAYLGDYIGLRNLTILGTFMSVIGLGLCYFAEDIITVAILFGAVYEIDGTQMSSKRQLTEDKQSSEDDGPPLQKKTCTEIKQLNEFCSILRDTADIGTDTAVPKKTPFVRVSEIDVGITEYVNDLPGFNAVMKERYSDFLVNEIDVDGNMIRLTDLLKPENPEHGFTTDNLLDAETSAKIENLLSKSVSEVTIEVTDKDKAERKALHVALRQAFPNIESSTEDRDGKKFIVVKNVTSKKGRRFQPSIGGNYLHFVLYKENRDTMDTINSISSFLRVPPKVFSYAGSKDKRGKTSQLVSAYRLNPGKLLSINTQFNMIKVGNIVYKNVQLKLGDLWGNNFVMVLRQLDGKSEIVEKALKSLATNGFINYYGLQRFGTSSVPTHVVGRSILLGDMNSAIDLILTPRTEDSEELLAAKKIWRESQDANKALKNLRKKWSIEGKLLTGLATCNSNDLCNAFNAIPRNMRLMYLHSYQSYIWNKVASKRIRKYGLKVLKGDLISTEDYNKVSEGCVEADVEEDGRKAMLSNMVKVVAEGDVDKYSITDVLLPLPGHSVVFPENETKDWYNEFLKEDGMSWSNLDSKIKSHSLSGAYRKIVIVPENIQWEIISYSDVTAPLALSDLDILQHNFLPDFNDSGPLKALKLEFKLPSSCYATMAVREVLKQSTCYLAKT